MDAKKKTWFLYITQNTDDMPILKKNNGASSHTGTVAETIIDSFLISGNSLTSTDILRIMYSETKSGTAGGNVIKIRIHTSVAVGGTVISTGSPASTSLWYKGQKDLIFKNSLTSQVVYGAADTNNVSDITNINVAKTSLSLDFTVDQYMIITFTLANAADTATLESWLVQAIR